MTDQPTPASMAEAREIARDAWSRVYRRFQSHEEPESPYGATSFTPEDEVWISGTFGHWLQTDIALALDRRTQPQSKSDEERDVQPLAEKIVRHIVTEHGADLMLCSSVVFTMRELSAALTQARAEGAAAERAKFAAFCDEKDEPRNVLRDIINEREEQDRRFGGPAHDDQHDEDDWLNFIRKHTRQAELATPSDYRYEMIRIAALAVAAVESQDRLTQAAEQARAGGENV